MAPPDSHSGVGPSPMPPALSCDNAAFDCLRNPKKTNRAAKDEVSCNHARQPSSQLELRSGASRYLVREVPGPTSSCARSISSRHRRASAALCANALEGAKGAVKHPKTKLLRVAFCATARNQAANTCTDHTSPSAVPHWKAGVATA